MSVDSFVMCNITTFTRTSRAAGGGGGQIDIASVLFLRCSVIMCGVASSRRTLFAGCPC